MVGGFMKTGVFLFFLALSFSLSATDFTKESIKIELENYPEASLRDIYKNFFQEAHGPGHIIPDTVQAGKYLSWELKQPFWTDTLKWQPLGSKHDYYRINLSLVKEKIIPRNILLEGMVESVPLARNPDIEVWKKEWGKVMEVINELGIQFPDFEKDKKVIDDLLNSVEVVMHHSDNYIEKYHPHYRIVHRDVFLRWRKSFLKE